MTSPIRAVTFDAAGTLIHVRDGVGATYARFAHAHGIPADAHALDRAFRIVFPRMSPLAFGPCDPPALERQERDWWRTLVRGCLGPHGQHPAFAAFFDDVYAFYGGPDAWALYPEVPEVLQRLDAMQVPMAVVSNFDRRLHRVLEHLGVHDRFRVVLCSSEAGAAKPDERIFAAACRVLGAAARDTLHAGDSRSADLDGALAAGLHALLVRRDRAAAADPRVIDDLRPVPARVADS